MRKLLISITSITFLCLFTNSALADGWAKGTGIAQGKGIVKGQGTLHGTGIYVTRDKDGNLKRGRIKDDTVSGKGVFIGKGIVRGRGKAYGKGRVKGKGKKRRR